MEERGLIRSWRKELATYTAHNQDDHPNYWAQQPSSLITTSNITSLNFGTGDSIYRNLQPALECVSHELILVTCFWARSRTLDTFNAVLRSLSKKAQQSNTEIRVRICFSSSSLFQKLLHTFSRDGQLYPPDSWPVKLGLPSAQELPGLDIQVKSIFFLPFSVMHPKFIICDRRQVFLPSCNVSWEDWFEGCIGLTGDVVLQFTNFWIKFWAGPADKNSYFPYSEAVESGALDSGCYYRDDDGDEDTAAAATAKGGGGASQSDDRLLVSPSSPTSSADLPVRHEMNLSDIKTIFLPSPHHINPQFRLLPWQIFAPPPPTPLNTFLLSAITLAKSTIYIQSPNLTSPPVLNALLGALRKPGLNVHIVTSARLMILEQLVTGGSTTSRCVKLLVKQYSRLIEARAREWGVDLEAAKPRLGHLKIEFYEPRRRNSGDDAAGLVGAGVRGSVTAAEPLQSHLKCTIVDAEVVVLGSGNLDRASWYTSQELGVAFFSKQLAATIKTTLDGVLSGRKKLTFDSSR